MKNVTSDPIQSSDEGVYRQNFRGLEDAIRDAARRAICPGIQLATVLNLYRSVVVLTNTMQPALADDGIAVVFRGELRPDEASVGKGGGGGGGTGHT